jgi:hypothetical protein
MTDEEEAPPSSDRRRALRRVACFPGMVEHPGEDAKITAMISDLAETGTKLLMRRPDFSVGDDLRLELHVLLEEGAPRVASGRVVRIEEMPEERAFLWTHEVGVHFHDRLELSTAEIEAMDKRQKPFGKK